MKEVGLALISAGVSILILTVGWRLQRKTDPFDEGIPSMPRVEHLKKYQFKKGYTPWNKGKRNG